MQLCFPKKKHQYAASAVEDGRAPVSPLLSLRTLSGTGAFALRKKTEPTLRVSVVLEAAVRRAAAEQRGSL